MAVIWTAPADVCGLRGLRVARGASDCLKALARSTRCFSFTLEGRTSFWQLLVPKWINGIVRYMPHVVAQGSTGIGSDRNAQTSKNDKIGVGEDLDLPNATSD